MPILVRSKIMHLKKFYVLKKLGFLIANPHIAKNNCLKIVSPPITTCAKGSYSKSNRFCKSAYLLICDLPKLFVDRPPLHGIETIKMVNFEL
jgi:hypothetical protein